MSLMQANTAVGKNISGLRIARGISQASLARRLGAALGKNVDPATITRMESGKRPTTVDEIAAVADILEIPVEQLLYGATGSDDGKRVRDVLQALASAEKARFEFGRAFLAWMGNTSHLRHVVEEASDMLVDAVSPDVLARIEQLALPSIDDTSVGQTLRDEIMADRHDGPKTPERAEMLAELLNLWDERDREAAQRGDD
ncbi:helix-turn-helix domain-containing protein [Tsukamurella tyrosinosolvens]|uniref:helix-turn-helix domain-containing protein n=1 Tax=Tsukamurella tyrosinosolvens TaxID=57704 RepID=UPI000C7F180C|nr:helix-turn-helix transcriptional regulator [Tsukamurella tyrosinosolvens]AUN40930.1 hypothetical protein ASU32_13695 [Tsukamurella tyrosinosolvens]